MSVDDLRMAVTQLTSQDLDEFSRWFEEFVADRWDQQIEADIRSGRLDKAAQEADQDFEAGRCTPLVP